MTMYCKQRRHFGYIIFTLCCLGLAQGVHAQTQRVDEKVQSYIEKCLTYMNQRLDSVTAKRLCNCRAERLSSRIDPSHYGALITGGEDVPMADIRAHARNIVAPCQYLAFQSGVLQNCRTSQALHAYREQSATFCVCYAHERSVHMKTVMPQTIERILEENPGIADPFSALYEHEDYNAAVRRHIKSCL